MMDYDAFYHDLFGHDGTVAALLRAFVAVPLLDDLDLDGITRENAKWHGDSGKRRESDTVWRVPRRGGGDTYVLILLEFQSTIDRWVALRVMVYAGLLWQHLIKAKRLLPDGRLPPILPIVLYNGDAPWTASLALKPLVGLAEGSPLWEWQPDMRYYIMDEGSYGHADLAKREGLMPLLFRLESAAEPGHLGGVAGALAEWFAVHPAPESLRLLFMELLRNAAESLAPGMVVPNDFLEAKNMLVTRMEAWKQKQSEAWKLEWRQESLQEGRQEGRQAGRQEGEAAFLLRLLERRFGVLPGWVTERVSAAETGLLEERGLRVLEVGSLDEVFA